MTILITIWPGVTERMTSAPIALGRTSSMNWRTDGQRHVGLEQGRAHFAQRGVDIGFRERTAPAQPVEHIAQTFAQTFEHPVPHSVRPNRYRADARTFADQRSSPTGGTV